MKKNITILILCLLISSISKAQSTSGYQLFAHYPFTTNADDVVNNVTAYTVNATYSATNGVYSNGTYNGGNSNGGVIILTENYSNFDENNFIITVEMKPEILNQHLFSGGGMFGHWLYLSTSSNGNLEAEMRTGDGTVTEYYTSTNPVFTVNTWQTLGIKYVKSENTISFYVNNNLVGTKTLSGNLFFDGDHTLSNENGSAAFAYKGYYKNLKIYKNANASVSGFNDIFKVEVSPNPSKGIVSISNADKVKLQNVYSILGKRIPFIQLPNQQIKIQANSGIYLLQFLTENNKKITKKIIIN